MMRFDILTLFPAMFESPLNDSILKRAIDNRLISVSLHNFRDFATDKHRTVDDTPYGGGSGMVLKPEPLVSAIESIADADATVIHLTPRGKPFDQKMARRLSEKKALALICGRYEGVDERVSAYVDEEISIGDFILTGGEIAAMALIDAVARLLPGVLGCENSNIEESFSWDLIEYPHYTRPRVFKDKAVPEILLSGNHESIRLWRRGQALKKTMRVRPDLLETAKLSAEDLELIKQIK